MNGTTPFFRPGGTMDPSAPSYIERAADAQLFEALARGEYVFLLDSRQKGKSSMVARAIVKLRQQGVSTVKLDLQRLGSNVTPEQWYAGLIGEIGAELGLTNDLFQYWGDRTAVGPLARWIGAIKDVVLKKTTAPLVVFIDEIDFVRALPFATDEFFAGIRDCYNRRSENCGFERLTFCLIGVATPGQLIRNPEITPFNIGQRIDVSDFTLADSKPFAEALSLDGRNGNALLARVHHWLSGHPYLTQLLCSQIAADSSIAGNSDVDRLVKSLFLTPESRQREPNFADVERRMLDPDVPGLSDDEKRTQALELYGRVLKGKRVDAVEENPIVATLRLSGIGLEDRSTLRIRNRLYSFVFDEKWRRQSMPDAELRRQRGAARLALIRATAVAGVIVLGVTAVAFNMNRLANDRSKAITRLQSTSSDLNNLSNAQAKSLSDLTKRTNELQRVTQEKQRSLTDLRLRTRQLQQTSQERAKALTQLGEQNRKLAKLSGEKSRAIAGLKATTSELERQNYYGVTAAMRLSINEGRWLTAGQLLEESRTHPRRGWEWGYVANLAGRPDYMVKFKSFRNEFEYDAEGNIFVVSEDSISKITPTGLAETRVFHGQTIYPFGGRDYRSNLRMGIDPANGQYVFRNKDSDQIVARVTGWSGEVSNFDGVEKSIQVTTRKGIVERRTLDGKTIIETENWRNDALIVQALYSGGCFVIYRDGMIRRLDANRKVLAEAKFEGFRKDAAYWCSTNRKNARWLAVADRRAGTLALVDGISLATLWAVDIPGIRSPSVSLDGRYVLAVSNDASIDLLHGATGTIIRKYFGHSDIPLRVGFLADSRHFATLDRAGMLRVWPVDHSTAVDRIPADADPAIFVSPTRNGRYLVGNTQNRKLVSVDLQTGKTASYDGVASNMSVWKAGDSDLFAGTWDGRIERISSEDMNVRLSAKIFKSAISDIFVLAKGKRLYVEEWLGSSSVDQTRFSILDAKTLEVIRTLVIRWPAPQTGNLIGFISEDGETLLIAGNYVAKPYFAMAPRLSSCFAVISASNAKVISQGALDNVLGGCAISPDGSIIYAALMKEQLSAMGQVVALDAKTLKQVKVLQQRSDIVTELRTYRDGKLLAGLSANGYVTFWDTKSGKRLRRVKDTAGSLLTAASPDGTRLVRYHNGAAHVIDAETGEEVFSLYEQDLQLHQSARRGPRRGTGTAFFVDNQRIAVSSPSGEIFVFKSLK